MTRTTQQILSWVAVCLATAVCIFLPRAVWAANSVVWEAGNSLVDTTNYTGLAPNYWFANFGNSSAVTGAPMDQNEARNLPSWIHLESRPACIGKADNCSTNDATIRTGFSFSENTTTGASGTSIGGQPNFDTLTLPNAATGLSGEAVDSLSTTGNTSSFLDIRILAGAPSSFRMWVVTDNGSGANYHSQARMRVNLRDTNGPPDYTGDIGTAEAEVLPGGLRLDNAANPQAHNGIADAWSFLLSDVNENDIVIVRPSSAAGSLPGFAGIMIQAIPEPSSVVLLIFGALACAPTFRRGHRG